jgi:AAA15 family ATPase/GTPase
LVDDYADRCLNAVHSLFDLYVRDQVTTVITYQQFKKRWNNYKNNVLKLRRLGFTHYLDRDIEFFPDFHIRRIHQAFFSHKTKFPQFPKITEEMFEAKKVFLINYLEKFSDTITRLLEEYPKYKLFSDIFMERNRLTNKRIVFTKYGPQIFKGNERIELEQLSSGEKNDFIMFYRLIFECENNTVLIDEPEISLHIEWQENYLNMLNKICKINNLQAIVATHSPYIIGEHLDLVVEKK